MLISECFWNVETGCRVVHCDRLVCENGQAVYSEGRALLGSCWSEEKQFVFVSAIWVLRAFNEQLVPTCKYCLAAITVVSINAVHAALRCKHNCRVPKSWEAGPSDRGWGVGLDRCDRGFESRLRHGCLSSSVLCVSRGLCDGLITRRKESYGMSK
jgi:hypothetical protein